MVPIYEIPGVNAELKFTGPLIADIFMGKVTKWNDPAIVKLNPGVKLPTQAIVVVHRADGSVTTFNFTDYLSKVSPQWKEQVGSDLLVKWPTGQGVRGNDRMAQTVRQTRHSIGYVDFANAVQAGLAYAALQNRAGRFVPPSVRLPTSGSLPGAGRSMAAP